jgi:hypothetical protein
MRLDNANKNIIHESPKMAKEDRFFTREQKAAHAQEIGGMHSELLDEFGNPYPGRIECHHMDSYWKSHDTSDENLLFTDICSHAILHLMADEPYSFQLIKKRMTQEELQELHRRGY